MWVDVGREWVLAMATSIVPPLVAGGRSGFCDGDGQRSLNGQMDR